MTKFKNKCVVITGAGSGIGRACAMAFAGEGAAVVVADINADGAKATVDLIRQANGTAIACEADVSSPESVRQLVSHTMERYQAVHALVNNAAIQVNKTVEDTSFEEWTAQLAVNLGGVFLCSKYFLPHLRETRGSIVNMSSVNGFFV